MNRNLKNSLSVKSVWLSLALIFSFFLTHANLIKEYSMVMWSVPPAPTNLTVSAVTSTQFRANWTASPGATSYRIDVSATSNFSSGNIAIDSANSPSTPTSFFVTGLMPGTAYYFRVRARNADGTSPNSAIRSLVTPPATPILYGASTAGSNYFLAHWSQRKGANDYRMDVSLSDSFSSFVYANLDAGNDSSIMVKNLSPGTNYFFRVRALNSLGASGNSQVKSIKTFNPLPPTPTAKAATNVTIPIGFTANWSPNGSTAGVVFYIDVARDPSFASIDISTTTSDSSVYIPFLAPASYYRIRAHNSYGFSGYSNTSPPVHTAPALAESELKIYPNPVSSANELHVEVGNLKPETNIKVNITTLAGDRSIEYTSQVNKDGTLRLYVPATTLTSGTYVLKVQGKTFRLLVN